MVGCGRWEMGRIASGGIPAVVGADELTEGLMHWQRAELEQWWGAGVVGCIIPRQNGKTELALIRAVLGALHGEQVLWTAHEFATVRDAMGRLLALCEAVPAVAKRVAVVRRHTQMSMVAFQRAGRVIFRARTRMASRGIAGVDVAICDEALTMTGAMVAAIAPTQAAAEQPLFVALSSPGLATSEWMWAQREAALRHAGTDVGAKRWVEWTAARLELDDAGRLVQIEPDDFADEALWAAANPALGTLISRGFLARQLEMLGPRVFAREHLGVWDAPLVDPAALPWVDARVWSRCEGVPMDAAPIVLGWDVGRERSAVAVAIGTRERPHVELVDERAGVAWLLDRVPELVERHGIEAVAAYDLGPNVGLAFELERRLAPLGVRVRRLRSAEWGRAAVAFAAAAEQQLLTHPDQPLVGDALAAVRRRRTATGWLPALGDAEVPVHPAVAAVVAWAALVSAPLDASGPVFAW